MIRAKICSLLYLSSLALASCSSSISDVSDEDAQASAQASVVDAVPQQVKIDLFGEHLHPILTENCGVCHSANQDPKFAADSVDDAFSALVDGSTSKVNFTNPGKSRIVTKQVGPPIHNCGQEQECQALALKLTSAISDWVDGMRKHGEINKESVDTSPIEIGDVKRVSFDLGRHLELEAGDNLKLNMKVEKTNIGYHLKVHIPPLSTPVHIKGIKMLVNDDSGSLNNGLMSVDCLVRSKGAYFGETSLTLEKGSKPQNTDALALQIEVLRVVMSHEDKNKFTECKPYTGSSEEGGNNGRGDIPQEKIVAYNNIVQSLFRENCGECHTTGQPGIENWTVNSSVEETWAVRELLFDSIEKGRMPSMMYYFVEFSACDACTIMEWTGIEGEGIMQCPAPDC